MDVCVAGFIRCQRSSSALTSDNGKRTIRTNSSRMVPLFMLLWQLVRLFVQTRTDCVNFARPNFLAFAYGFFQRISSISFTFLIILPINTFIIDKIYIPYRPEECDIKNLIY